MKTWIFFSILEVLTVFGYFTNAFAASALGLVVFGYYGAMEYIKASHAKRLETSNEALLARMDALEKDTALKTKRMEEAVARSVAQNKFL